MAGPGAPITSRRSVLRGSALGVGAALTGAAVTAAAQPAAAAGAQAATAAASSGRIFLVLDRIFGDSAAEAHPNAIEVSEVKWGVAQATATNVGAGLRAGRAVAAADLVTLTARTGSHTPGLLARCVGGRSIATGQVDLVGPALDSGGDLPVVRIKLTEVFVAALHTQFSSEGDLVDEFSLSFKTIAYGFFPQKPDGSAGDPLLTTWDVQANTVTTNALRTPS